MKHVWKNKLFLTGFCFIVLLLLLSFLYSYFLKDVLPKPPDRIYNEKGILIDDPPYPPSWQSPFALNRQGDNTFWLVIDGAKYTIFIAIVASFIRLALGTIGGMMYSFYLQRLSFIIEAFVRAFRFMPAVLFVMPFIIMIPSGNYFADLTKQMIPIILVAVLPFMSVMQVEINQFMKNDFVTCSRTIGATNGWLIRKHVMPYLRSRLFLLFTQQVVQVLLLMMHLAVFGFVLGGMKDIADEDLSAVSNPNQSLTNEWSGLIGLSYRELMLDKWIVIGPCIGFVLVIFAFNLISRGIEQSLSEKVHFTEGKKRNRRRFKQGEISQVTNTNSPKRMV